MTEKIEELLKKIKELQNSHNNFKEKIRDLDISEDKKKVFNELKNVKNLISEILDSYDELEDQASVLGLRIPKNMRKDIYNMNHQIDNSLNLYREYVNER